MRQALLRLVAAAAGLAVVGCIALLVTVRSSLPRLDGTVVMPQLASSATIERDAMGIPTITAGSRPELAFATGYVHGQDRFFQMELIRRQAAGELSELLGAAAVDADKRFRFHRFRDRANAAYAALSDDEKALLQSYADGVNAGLDSLAARPFEYFALGVKPEPWQPQDSLLAVYAMFLQLNDARGIKDVRRGLAHHVLAAEVYRWMYPQGTPWDAPIMGEARSVLPIPDADILDLRNVADTAPSANEQAQRPLPGSNNWAVSGSLTASGRALVSNDMHLDHSVPNIYYRARLRTNDEHALDVSGVTLPGTPFLVAGSNSRVAWGFTNSYGDYTDVVVLRPGEQAASYEAPEGDLAFDVFRETINVKDADPVVLEIRETIWGPVLDGVDFPGGELAVSWIAHKPDSLNLRLMQLESVASVSEALEVANSVGIPPQNFVTGDADGNIAWTIIGKIPRRSDHYDPLLPADWSEQSGWTGWLEPEYYPRIVNPESGRIWTANSRVVDAEALHLVGDGGYDLGARAQQIRDSLFAKESFTAEDMLTIQYDDRALFLSPWRDVLLQILTDDTVVEHPELNEYRQLVRDWIPRAVAESVGYRLVRAFRLEVQRRLFYALTTPLREEFGEDVELRRSKQFEAALWSTVRSRPAHLLPSDYQTWDDFLLAAVLQNVSYFSDNFEGPLSERTWGEVNTAAIRHPLSGSIPIFGRYLNMKEEPLNGDSNLPKAQGASFGASERFSVYPGDEANSLLQMPTGQSGHPMSAFFAEGHDDWVKGRPTAFLPSETQHTLTLSPQ